ncbi:MAG: P-II family nitrogen regulator [Actinomycetaceae bacterium]|nr:P-II family nitrogen regulator [Actinomycetaceae bacterium]MDU0970432.1 P-II family nitrogen regulator [Actinomycetaceae bacterium]
MVMKVEAIVREEKLDDIKTALLGHGISGATVSEVMGFGTQRGYKEMVRGTEVVVQLRRKLKIEVVVPDEAEADEVVALIRDAAYTGRIGDGKIFVYPLTRAVRIRSGEDGVDAVASVGAQPAERG